MSKRLTDSKKWRSSWFRKLTLKAKLAWVYLCDECDFTGLFKIDYELASFQLDFDITPTLVRQWFGDKIFFIEDNKIFIVPFFEFQYGESKDSWTAKARAKEKIEALGFKIESNKVIVHKTTVQPLSIDSDPTGLSICEYEYKSINVLNKEEKIEKIYRDHYPRKIGKSEGIKAFSKIIKTDQDLADLEKAVIKYKESIKPGTDPSFVKYFSSFASSWRDYLDKDVGTSDLAKPQSHDVSHVWNEDIT